MKHSENEASVRAGRGERRTPKAQVARDRLWRPWMILGSALLVAGCAPSTPLVGTWRSVALEGRTLEEQSVTGMRLEFTPESLAMTTDMAGPPGPEIDRRTMPYVIEGDVLRLEPTSTESGGAMVFRLRGDSLFLEVVEPADASDVRIRLVRGRNR